MQSHQLSRLLRAAIWVLAGLVVLVVLVVSVTAATLPGCASCHASGAFAKQTAASAHAKIDCVRCHVSPGIPSRFAYASGEIFGMVLKIGAGGGRASAAVPDEVCLSCHGAVLTEVVSANSLRIKHADCAKGSRCSDCHSGVAHGSSVAWQRTPQMEQCLDCHNTTKVRDSCNTCHDAKTKRQRLASGSWTVTHGPNWRTTHGMGDWKTCTACHPNDYCVQCHGMSLPHDADFLRTHGAPAIASRANCDVCHKPAFCDGCHGLEMPHPAGFTPSHSKIVKAKGRAVCLACHTEEDCTKCHIAHVHPGGAGPVGGATSAPTTSGAGG